MRLLLIPVFILSVSLLFAQTVAAPQPIEERYNISAGWWILGVLLAIGVGIALYMLIKKDPRRDAVR